MIDLSQRSEPYELELPYGLRVTVRPLTTAGMGAAQAAGRRAVEAIERQAREHTEAGLALDGLPDFLHGGGAGRLLPGTANPRDRGPARRELDRGRAGRRPGPPTPENIAAVMDLYPVGERFFQEFTLRQVLLNAAKNGSGPSGISSSAKGPSTARPAGRTTCPAPEASPAPTVGSAPTASTP
jgi:hypothetical protein